jgi:hypothetical protein
MLAYGMGKAVLGAYNEVIEIRTPVRAQSKVVAPPSVWLAPAPKKQKPAKKRFKPVPAEPPCEIWIDACAKRSVKIV